ncbi:nucleoside phosphorylase [uncultured Rhodospira sp.]|uniref:phosphorylase family protein n=1 Tax=uncultured Rhodospira sp. TaxID=1936189 RepID=UPI002628AB99|nr:nucleoside phosphorylase [uncultured Rhodospira sp.]
MPLPSPGSAIGVVTGLTGERRALEALPGLTVRCEGPGPDKAEAAARALLDEGARALVSAGVCGALDPALRPGAVVLPARVVNRHNEGESWLVDAVWHAAVMAAAPPDATFNTGALLGSDTPVVSVGGKHHLAARTGAVAVDMESHAVARVAAEANVPFLVVRTVADTAADALPRWLAGVLNRDGTPNAGAAARRILLGPWRLPTLIRLAKRNAAAEQALSEAGAALARATRP